MAEIRAIEIPKWGLTMEEGMLGSWHVAEGTSFTKGQALCTIESSKIANELEAPFDGFLEVGGPALLAVVADALAHRRCQQPGFGDHCR